MKVKEELYAEMVTRATFTEVLASTDDRQMNKIMAEWSKNA